MNFGMSVDRMFAGGRIAMFLSGIWGGSANSGIMISMDVVMFPRTTKESARSEPGDRLCDPQKPPKHKEAAWEVIKALTGPEGQRQFAKRGLAQPARISVATSDAFAGDPSAPATKRCSTKRFSIRFSARFTRNGVK